VEWVELLYFARDLNSAEVKAVNDYFRYKYQL
jgi:hypothetical protein